MTLISFRGRAADRNDRAMSGADRLAVRLGTLLNARAVTVGIPAPALAADWTVELPAALSDLTALQTAMAAALDEGGPVIVTQGRCAASLATLPAAARARPDAAFVWFDAHGDCNTPASSGSGYLGGMVLSGAAGLWDSGLGDGLKLTQVVLVGTRDLDPFEKALIAAEGIRLVAPGPGLPSRLREAIGGRPIYVHLDCDVLDAGLVPSDYQVAGGLSFRDLRQAFGVLAEHDVVGCELAEFEDTWPDGSAGDVDALLAAIRPLLDKLGGGETLEPAARLRRLHFRAWHRGTREADLLIGGFLDACAAEWGAGEIAWFEALLDEQDVDIMAWAIGTAPVPPRWEGPMMERMRRLDYVAVAR